MTGLPIAEYQENFEVNKIKDQDLTPVTRKSRISEAKRSFSQHKNSSLKSIFNMANTMVGSSIVVFPNLFQQSGIITSLIVLLIIGSISCKTCLIELTHFKSTELDFADTILRILGRRWFFFYNFASILLLFVSGIIYFLLIAKMGYSFLVFVFQETGAQFSPQSHEDFSQFSYQYFGFIAIGFSFILFSLKDLEFILKLGQYGIISIMIFAIYVIVKGIINIPSDSFKAADITLLTSDFATICGVLASAFFLHNLMIPIIKKNRDEKNNSRDVVLGYVLGGSFYAIIGIFGAVSIAGLPDQPDSQTVLDYYGSNIYSAIIEILLFLQLSSVLPVLWYVCRSQFFNLVFKTEKVPKKWYFLTNAFFSAVCLGIQIKNVDPSLVISLNGAICCYFMIYTIPIALHLKCLYGKDHKTAEPENSINGNEDLMGQNRLDDDESSYIENYDPKKIEWEKECNDDHGKIKKRAGKFIRFMFYAAVSMLGAAFAILKIVNLFGG